jgi:hypothetical protein
MTIDIVDFRGEPPDNKSLHGWKDILLHIKIVAVVLVTITKTRTTKNNSRNNYSRN